MEALRAVNLLQERDLLPPRPLEAPEPNLSAELKKVNCSPQSVLDLPAPTFATFSHSVAVESVVFVAARTFRCTLTSVPQTQALLNKARLPLGLVLHPFRDLQVCCSGLNNVHRETSLASEVLQNQNV